MKLALIIVLALVLVFVLIRSFRYHNAIRHWRCPICGAPIMPFANEHCEGLECTECDWWEATDITLL